MSNTVHATALVAHGTGILILGASGSGKSELALDLIDQCRLRGVEAVLVGDDRLVIETSPDGVMASAPDPIAGLIEVRGAGIFRIGHIRQAKMDLAIRLVELSQARRMPEAGPVEVLPGICLPCLDLPQRNFAATRAALVLLGIYGGILGPNSEA